MIEPMIVKKVRHTFAKEYAEHGWKVFPVHVPKILPNGAARCSCGEPGCGSIGKHPMTEHGLKDASVDPLVIGEWWERWPGANVGIATGAESRIVVLDVDAGKGGEESLERIIAEHGPFDMTAQVHTGGGGAHYVFSHPGFRVPNSNGEKGWLKVPGIDVRGDGGYIVAPPSLHASGSRYAWEDGQSPGEMAIQPMPAWMLERVPRPEQAAAKPRPTRIEPGKDLGRYWLGRALADAGLGNRNDVGFWLAGQLRDSGLSKGEAESIMREYVHRVPVGGNAYTEREALASLNQAFARPAREPAIPAECRDRPGTVAMKVMRETEAAKPKAQAGAAAELNQFYSGVIDGKIFNAPWPWDYLTQLTQALLPGTITVLCGDPGVGKTFVILQCLDFWLSNDLPSRVFFIEKDRVFHTRRLLAQLAGNGNLVDFEWVKKNPEHVRKAMQDYGPMVDEMGRCIDSSPCERVTLDGLLNWIRQHCSAGKRILVIDPITAAFAGIERWTKDDDFILAAQKLLTTHGASLVLVTHAKKGHRHGASSGHDMAAGAAFFRFSDTTIWLKRTQKPVLTKYRTKLGPTSGRLSVFFQILKARDGRGSGLDIAYTFGPELLFTEQGIVEQFPREEEEAA